VTKAVVQVEFGKGPVGNEDAGDDDLIETDLGDDDESEEEV
jgi:hypothetical protein